MESDRLARVNEAQCACLRLVLQHKSSKDIARALGISPHTVDQRIRLAMKALGAPSRVEAARILAAAEQGDGYQSLIYQAPDIDPPPAALPFPPDGEVRRDGKSRNIVWIMVSVAAALAFAGLFIGLNALSQFTR
ncbi:MAG: hypothetical protein QOD42_3344 [Sphingomonadales bacterium]|jgi:DNA-binding CsgD family transcriptional regulator|nr:hypothetical protein [Sphingomonadales bacterium]